ncbi:hypothetical protein PL11201_650016 [Planktothrix sp. PCC 11201]|nr:hypothetical protein PL11201_650016 [Planktothrix sp. PCC 11201]
MVVLRKSCRSCAEEAFTHPLKRIITAKDLVDGVTLNWETKTTKLPNEHDF